MCSPVNATLTRLGGQSCNASLHAGCPAHLERLLAHRLFAHMHMTRPPARSSFTFEIKRANRRMPEVLNDRKTSLFAGPSLADQVFGKFSGSSTGPYRDGSPSPALDARLGPLERGPRETNAEPEPTRQTSPRRVLPDLLSALLNPVEERLRQETEERAARRRAARGSRARVKQGEHHRSSSGDAHAVEQIHPEAPEDNSGKPENEQASARKQVTQSLEETVTAPELTSAQFKRSTNRKAAARRAQKKGLPRPRLPAGERWKARLNWTCW